MKQKLQIQVTGLSSTYVFFNQKCASWLEFEPCKYPKFKFIRYINKHFHSFYIKCLEELDTINDDTVCEWFYEYGYEDGDTYTFISD